MCSVTAHRATKSILKTMFTSTNQGLTAHSSKENVAHSLHEKHSLPLVALKRSLKRILKSKRTHEEIQENSTALLDV